MKYSNLNFILTIFVNMVQKLRFQDKFMGEDNEKEANQVY